MFIKLISLLPEILLFLNIVVIELVRLCRQSQTPKTFATISKFFIALALISCIILYNISFNKIWYVNTLYTTFFKSLMLLSVIFSNFLAEKWFISKDYPSHRYYQTVSWGILFFSIAISCRHLGLLIGMLFMSQIVMGRLNALQDDVIENTERFKFNFMHITFLSLLLVGSISLIGGKTDSLLYSEIIKFYTSQPLEWAEKIGAGMIISTSLFILGAAPFHLYNFQNAKEAILPSATFNTLIPLIAGQGILITLFYQLFFSLNDEISSILKICGIFSLILGAVGVAACKYLKQSLVCINIFNMGIVLLLYSCLKTSAIQCGIIYSLVYGISLFGLYTCYYGIRRHGEYIQKVEELSGLSENRPFIAAVILICCISLLGMPPLLGMLSNFSTVNILFAQHKFIVIGLIFILLSVLAYGLLGWVKCIYFNAKEHPFDRVDRGVYVCLFFNIALMMAAVLNPKYLMHDVETLIHTFLM